ncbi:DUF3592 domain-containing protein [Frankia sp. Cas3]|uniref:DUF3592 domain-containing protein n=1 Tax=Frankia sp. Cas3 TaxID=3073926 RepID=UPI002AD4431A|nr:DUF3592 domain-containing protein [Frankia sp. Cas3]
MTVGNSAPGGESTHPGRALGCGNALFGWLLPTVVALTGAWLIGTYFPRSSSRGSCGDMEQRACTGSDAGYFFLGFGGAWIFGIACVAVALRAWTHRRGAPLGFVVSAGVVVALVCIRREISSESESPESPWLLVPIVLSAVAALAAVPLALRSRRRKSRRQLRYEADRQRLRERGMIAVGRIIQIADTGVTVNDQPRLTVTVSYTRADGSPATASVTRTFPRYELPRRGGAVQVRYLPEDPSQIEVILGPDDATVGTTPQDAAPRLVSELEHLAALHATGSLSEAEFTSAKRLLLGGA